MLCFKNRREKREDILLFVRSTLILGLFMRSKHLQFFVARILQDFGNNFAVLVDFEHDYIT